MDRSVRQSMDPVRRGSMDQGSVFSGHPLGKVVFHHGELVLSIQEIFAQIIADCATASTQRKLKFAINPIFRQNVSPALG